MPHPQLIVDVITAKRDDPNAIYDTRRVNSNNCRTRDWLAKHMTWAFKTGHAVHIAAIERDELVKLSQEQLTTERDRCRELTQTGNVHEYTMLGVTSREQAQRLADHHHAPIAIGPGKQCFAPYKVVRTLDDGAIMVEEI